MDAASVTDDSDAAAVNPISDTNLEDKKGVEKRKKKKKEKVGFRERKVIRSLFEIEKSLAAYKVSIFCHSLLFFFSTTHLDYRI